MIALPALALLAMTHLSPDYFGVYPLNASFLKPSVALYVVGSYKTGFGEPEEAFEYLGLVQSGKTKLVHSLAELRGSVEIKSGKDALDYVRLRTSPPTWFLWKGRPTVEMAEKERAGEMTNYGLHASLASGVKPKAILGKAGVSPATVQPLGQGYRVTRWLLVEIGGHTRRDRYVLKRVQEDVSADGGYQMRVLKQTPAANGWSIDKFE
ncbi:MAG: hypothetical protein ABIY70_22745 [Capsulimonas sp.]|uniref:hypothetical protein n=1 Tax=Capsulimonas sp. TaxID=2494211 RepID=UPI003267E975